MITQQKYGQGREQATCNPQTAQKPINDNCLPDDWRRQFLLRVLDDEQSTEVLFEVLRALRNHVESSGVAETLSEMFERWISTTYADLNARRYQIRDFVSHLAWLSEVDTLFRVLDSHTNYTKISQE